VTPAIVWPLPPPFDAERWGGGSSADRDRNGGGRDVRFDVTPGGASVAFTVIVKVPADTGVPLSWPAALRLNPDGTPVADHI
jgi:hypothetical protein